MTKPLKGLPARANSTTTNEEFISSRGAYLTQPVDQLDLARAGLPSANLSFGLPLALVGEVAYLKEAPEFCFCGVCYFPKGGSAPDIGGDSALEANVFHLAPPSTIADEGVVPVLVGGSVTGVIDATGDTDVITVDLVAGQTYLISLVGSGADPVFDTFLTLNAPGGALVNNDDDGGTGLFSLLTVTATVTGTYEIIAASFNNPGNPGTGEYTVTVQQQGADEAPTVPPTAASLTVGTTTFGFLSPGGDADIYEVTIVEGMVYTFSVAAGADLNTDYLAVPTGEVDTIIEIFDANGVLVASNDDINFPSDISSAAGFLSSVAGTYYVRVSGYPGQTGGYTLDSSAVPLGDLDPLDSIRWFSADNIDTVDVMGTPTAYVYFGAAGETFGEAGLVTFGWNATEIAAVMLALAEFSEITGIQYLQTNDINQAEFRLNTVSTGNFGAYFYPQDPAFGSQQGIGIFNVNSGGWDKPGVSTQDLPGNQLSLEQGGFAFAVILHEFGHAHGLAHPHDNGGGSDVLLGVTGATGSLGVFNLNQGVYTVMSYNDAWQLHPDGPSSFTIAGIDNGWSGTLSAFDIAVLQERYGVHAYNGGDTIYNLTDIVDDAFYQTIWDSGGTDAIAYGGTFNAVIDLTAATLDYTATGGGVLSFLLNPQPLVTSSARVRGGYTIANGVVIENATGGSGNDVLLGNDGINLLTGNGGNDVMMGRTGNDTLNGGAGVDTAVFSGNEADYTVTQIVGGYLVIDNNAADGDDGIDTIIDVEILQFADDADTIDPDNDPNTNTAPTLTGVVASVTYLENTVNTTAQVLDIDVDFQDPEGNFDGGTLVVSGLVAGDVVGVRNQGVQINQVSVAGTDITYNGLVIGSIAGGTGTDLVVTFNSAATAPAVDAVIQNLTYRSTSQEPAASRTLTINVTDDAGASLAAPPSITVNVTSQNDAPAGTNNAIAVAEDAVYTFTTGDFGFTDVDGDAFLAVVVSTLPNQGVLRLNGVAVTANQVITVADINAGLFTFTPDAGESGPLYSSFTFRVRDDGGTTNGGVNTDASPNTISIAVAPDNTPPSLTDVVDEVTYDENVVNVTPQILDLDVTFTDPDNNFDGGSLTVSGLVAGDVVSVNNEGTDPGEVGLSGGNVTYGGVVIGTVAGGVGNTLTITFNAAATSVAIDALIENLTYASTTDQPAATRTLTINVTDADGADLAYPAEFASDGFGPFAGLTNGGTYSDPALLDVDGDGDVDLLSGGNTGAIFYYRNDGNGGFAEVPGSQNPFNGMDFGSFSSVEAIDLDGDGDQDLVVGNSAGQLLTLRNENASTVFTVLAGAANPFNGVTVGTFSTPAAGDIDGDGDADLIVGNNAGTIATFRNNGNGTFTALTGTNNPFSSVDVGTYSIPSLFDIDGDGDLDAIITNSAGTFLAFNNGGAFTTAAPGTNPFEGEFVGFGAALDFADLDGDGDLDAVVGSEYGDFLVYDNVSQNSTQIIVNVTAQADIVELYDENDVLVETYSTIQLAIDNALDGYTIVAPAGTYTEDLVIDVDVTIEGANVGVEGDGTRGAETIIDGQVTVSADGVTIDGVSIVGDGAGPLGSTGVVVDSGSDDFSLVNSVLDGSGDFAIFVGLVSGLDVGNNLIQGYSIGIYIAGGNTSGSVHDNLFQGDGGPFTGLGNGVNSETSFVLIQNNVFDGIYSGSLNLFPFGPDPVDLDSYVIGNTISDAGPERPVQVYPTALSTHIVGTDFNEAFNGDIAGLASGTELGFDGQGGDDHIYGWDAADELSGGSGSDRIFAQQGDDVLNGGSGNDLLDGDAGIDTANFAAANLAYIDTVVGWLVQSSEGNDFLEQVEIVVDGTGQRTLLVGSTGFATLQAALDAAEPGDAVRLASGTYTGTVTYDDADLTVIAQPGATLDVTFTTTSGEGITVYGAGADDNITTGEGDDRLYGGAGNDTMTGGTGDDWYFVDGGDTVIEGAAEGTLDRVFASTSYTLTAGAYIEILSTDFHAGTAAIDLGGNELDNLIYGNAGDNDIDGHEGADAMIGFGGNDFYFVDNAGDYIVEGADEGTGDRVFASTSYTLTAGAHIEIFSTDFHAGTGAIDLSGNELGNLIYGNAGSNVLDGKEGNDALVGFGGADTFAFTTALGANNVDIIADFDADDTIALDDAVFTGLSLGALPANAFVTGSAAGDADDRIVYNQATGELFYDADGNGAGAQVLFATLSGNPILTASDFTVI